MNCPSLSLSLSGSPYVYDSMSEREGEVESKLMLWERWDSIAVKNFLEASINCINKSLITVIRFMAVIPLQIYCFIFLCIIIKVNFTDSSSM